MNNYQQEKEDLFTSLLKPINFVIAMLLLNAKKPHDLKSGLLFFAKAVFLTIVLVVIVFTVCCKSLLWYNSYKLDGFTLGQVINLASIIVLCESFVSFFFLIYWQYSNRINKISAHLYKATLNRGLAKYKLLLNRYVVFFVVSLFMYTAITTVALLSSFFEFTQFHVAAINYQRLLFGKRELDPLVAFAFIFNNFVLAFVLVIYVLVTLFVLYEVHYMNEEIESNKKLDICSLQLHFDTYKGLSSAVCEMSNTFSGYYFWMLCFQLPMIIFLSFNMMVKSLNFIEISIIGGWLVTGIAKVFVLSILPAKINEEVQ